MIGQAYVLDLCKRKRDDDGGEKTEKNQTAASTLVSAGDQSTQEICNTLRVIEYCKVEQLDYDDWDDNDSFINSDTENHDIEELVPEDLSSKVKVTQNDPEIEESNRDDSNVSSLQADKRELKNSSTETKENREEHLNKQSKEDMYSFQCPVCHVTFKSKDVLQDHLFSTQDIVHMKVNVVQEDIINRKGHLNEGNRPIDYKSPSSQDSSSEHLDLNIVKDNELANKRQQDKHLPLQIRSPSAIPAHLPLVKETSYESNTRVYEVWFRSSDSEMVDPHVCLVCLKKFSRPSDLKLHTLLHTSQKPFRCEYCKIPFRTKLDMEYHLKLTHAVDIDLSLEDRFLPTKTRAQTNLSRSGHLTSISKINGLESESYNRDNVDFDELDDDAKSANSFCQNTGTGLNIASDTLSKGGNCETGNDSKSTLDLSNSRCSNLTSSEVQSASKSEGIGFAVAPFKRSKSNTQNETVLVTRLDQTGGENSPIFKCYICSKMFPTLCSTQSHLSVHIDKTNVCYRGCFCDDIFQQKAYMQDHLRRKHAPDISALYSTKDSSFINDVQSDEHSSFSCRFCLKMFDNMFSLHKHTHLHTWRKNFCCKICGKTFSRYTNMQIHISRHHRKIVGKSKLRPSWVRSRRHFVNVSKLPPKLLTVFQKKASDELLKRIKKTSVLLYKDNTINIPQFTPAADGNISNVADTAFPKHLSEMTSDNPLNYTDESDDKIRTAPTGPLLPLKRDLSPCGRSSRKSTLVHSSYKNHKPSDDSDVLLNFSKSDRNLQDTNNNKASNGMCKGLSSEVQLPISAYDKEAIERTYVLSSTNHVDSLTSHSSSRSDTSPEGRDSKDGKRESILSHPKAPFGQEKAGPLLSPSSTDTGHTLTKTRSRLRIVKSPIDREATCKTFTLTDGRTGYKCTICSRIFTSYADINRHIDFHEDIRPFKCDYCDYNARTRSQIKIHMMRHQGIKRFGCKPCNFSAVIKSDLQRHLQSNIHQLKSRNACPYCGKGFMDQVNLEKHLDGNCIVNSRNYTVPNYFYIYNNKD
ncbi:zinc finger protein 236-like [Mercenaria mercenaria]|uniref:zinc finger protein 236-like n=1 Tax=Mercenaria mercenaria TaxID=6596 RepID=UPI00234E87CB|nr:zinc finger protein 236-like [Mercenaria mercenaria]